MAAFSSVAAGVAAAATVAGTASQIAGSGKAAKASASGATQAGAQYADLPGQADRILQGAERFGMDAYQPYSTLGAQGTNALSTYMGFVPEGAPGGAPRPVAPQSAESQVAAWRESLPSLAGESAQTQAINNAARDRYAEVIRQNSQNQLAEYNLAAAGWEKGQAEYAKGVRSDPDFGAYNRPYGIAEPAYKRFEGKDLMADPIYKTELKENVGAWDKSAAARGSLMSGNTVAGLRDLTAGGIDRGRNRFLQDYGIRHDEWSGGYERDFRERDRKYNALAGISSTGLAVTQRRVGLATDTAQGRVGARRVAATGQADAYGQAADARANGYISRGNAFANGFDDVGALARRYGSGAFGGQYGGSNPNNPDFNGQGWFN